MVSKKDQQDNDDKDKNKNSQPTEQATRTFKIVVIGDMNVGKTCLVLRLCNGKFPEVTETTIGVDFREKTLVVGNEKIKV